MSPTTVGVFVVGLLLVVLAELTAGIQKGRSAGANAKTRHRDHLGRELERDLSLFFDYGRKTWHKRYPDGERVRIVNQVQGQDINPSARGWGLKRDFQDGHVINQVEGHKLGHGNDAEIWFSNGHRGYLHTFGPEPGAGHRRRHESEPVPRVRRLAPTKPTGDGRPGKLNLPRGITYTWTRDYSSGKSFDEAAFKSKDKDVIVNLSFDDALKDANLTASATLYDFTGTTGLIAIKTRMRPGPCFLMDTSLTYDKVIAELDARNGSSVSTSAVISLDGTGNPVPLSERQAIVKKTPSLARQCRGREIVRTKPKGFSSVPFEGQTKELKVLTMDAEVAITVPAEPDFDFGPVRQWFQNNHKGQIPGKGRNIWKNQ